MTSVNLTLEDWQAIGRLCCTYGSVVAAEKALECCAAEHSPSSRTAKSPTLPQITAAVRSGLMSKAEGRQLLGLQRSPWWQR